MAPIIAAWMCDSATCASMFAFIEKEMCQPCAPIQTSENVPEKEKKI